MLILSIAELSHRRMMMMMTWLNVDYVNVRLAGCVHGEMAWRGGWPTMTGRH